LNNHPVPFLVDAAIQAARETGIRLHAARGAMDVGEDQGGTTPRAIVQERDVILEDFQRLVDRYHQHEPGAFVQIALAPCNTYAASPELLRESAVLAEKLDVRLHTHLSESDFENTFSVEKYGMRPAERLEANGWGSSRTWVAHATCLDEQEIACLGRHAIGIAHCPSANLLSFRRIAPVKRLELAGSPIGIGTDGGASAGHASLWMEARTAMQVGHLRFEDSRVSARDALRYATTGGAACLGRSHDLGRLRKGFAADLVVWPTNSIHFSGSWYDLVEALLRNGPLHARDTIVGGRVRVRNGTLQLKGIEDILARHHRLAFDWQKILLGQRNRPVIPPA
jgi:cytosine/adenosine deaminase-related metal-dependent hydrolase